MEFTPRNNVWRPVFLFAIIMAFWLGSIIAEVSYEKRVHVESWNDVSVLLPLPSPEWFEKVSFGFRNVVADMLWIDTVQIFTRWDAKSEGFPQHFDAIAKLAPRFEYPYIFGILVLPGYGGAKFLERVKVLAEQGMVALPGDWKIPFYLGVEYHVIGKDYQKALTYINYATDNPSAPPIVAVTRAIYTAKSGSFEAARALIVAMEKTADNDFTRNVAKSWLERIDFLESIQQAVRLYKQHVGSVPRNIAELVRAGFLPANAQLGNFDLIIQSDGMITFQK